MHVGVACRLTGVVLRPGSRRMHLVRGSERAHQEAGGD